MLFEQAIRDVPGKKPLNMSLYDYMLRSSEPAVVRACSTWENFFSGFPCTKQAELLNSFRSSKSEKNIAAAFELFLATFFQRLDYEIEGLERPDFLIRHGNEAFYLEACCVFPDFANTSSNILKSTIVKQINSQVTSLNFRASVRFGGHVQSPPRAVDIIRAIQVIVQDWEEKATQKDVRSLRRKIQVGQITIELTPMPKKNGDNFGESFIVCHSNNLMAVKSSTVKRVRKALKDKANKYEKSFRPLVLAINLVEAMPFSDEEVLEVLFGEEKIEVQIVHGAIRDMIPGRHDRGFWRFGMRKVNTSIPAIIFFHNIGPLDLAAKMSAVYFSPYDDPICTLKRCHYLTRYSYNSESDAYKSEAGGSYMKLLGLDDNWPN